MKMSGCALDAFEMVPRSLLTHLGRELGIGVPTRGKRAIRAESPGKATQ
jgi:hypothetical protein